LAAAFAQAFRRFGPALLSPSPARLGKAASLAPGWDPSDWTREQAARAALLLSLPATTESAALMDRLFEGADVGEAAALLKALPLLPLPEAHLRRAREGARSNVRTSFEAVALRNPYPARYFDEGAWNQLIAKALFVGAPLDPIVGLDRRANPALARLLIDHVAERESAGRTYDPGLWRLVEPFAGKEPGIEIPAHAPRTGRNP
jgi:hypothetical protein